MANRYVFHSRISDAKFRRILRLFALDLNAVQIADLTRLSRVSINRYLAALRVRMAWLCKQAAPMSGEIEVDESHFGARRMKGKRGRGAFGKTAVFGIYKRKGQVHTRIVPDCQKATLQAIIRGHVAPGSTLYSDGWGAATTAWWIWAIAGICGSRTGAANGRGGCAHQRHRGLLGLCQKPPGEVPRHEQTNLLSAPERVRVQVQSPA